MKRTLKLAIVAAIASQVFVGVSYADSVTMNWGPELQRTLVTFNQDFDLKYLNDYQNQKTDPDAHDTNPPRTVQGVENIQAAIRSNHPLAKRLEARGVNIHDVVNAEQAADGSITFWLK
jgi:hypothetical protein